MIRLHVLHRRSARTNALLVLRDTRWEDIRQINCQTIGSRPLMQEPVINTLPDKYLSVNAFHNHVEVAIQTHGYDTWQGGKSNLLIIMALTGRLSNTSYIGFQYSMENVMGHLTTTGFKAIPSERRSIEELEGMSWHLKPPEQTSIRPHQGLAGNEKAKYFDTFNPKRKKNAATGWGDEFSDDEVTPGKVTILEEKSDWDDDERSGKKDENLDIQKKESESEWENTFAAKRGDNHTILHLSKEEENDDLPYLKFRMALTASFAAESYESPNQDTTPIEEGLQPTGWGDESSDDEVTPGKVTILEERSDWDDDERSGGKILVIQERLAQNQQEFLDEYLPQWDENLAIQKKESESEWENPFVAKRGENHTILHQSTPL
ncbi:hypothetical protein Tco_0154890 [Tanacetum coccineum]